MSDAGLRAFHVAIVMSLCKYVWSSAQQHETSLYLAYKFVFGSIPLICKCENGGNKCNFFGKGIEVLFFNYKIYSKSI